MKIPNKILLIIFCVTIVTLSPFKLYKMDQIRKNTHGELRELLETVGERLTRSTTSLLWNFETEATKETVNSEFYNKNIFAISIHKIGKEEFFVARIRDMEIESNQMFNSAIKSKVNLLQQEFEISKNDEILGIVAVYITTRFMKEKLRRELLSYFFVDLMALLLSLILVTIFLIKNISKPLKRLSNEAMVLAQGDLSQEIIGIKRADEIGNLANSLNRMRNAIKDNIKNLEDKVNERTTELSEATLLLKIQTAEAIENAHKAGMADIATGTLHNVGNILNSVKSSADTIVDILTDNTSISKMNKANDLLKQNRDNIEDFILNDPRGKMLLDFYIKIYEDTMLDENKILIDQTSRLNDKIESIIDVIAVQQDIAGGAVLNEFRHLKDIIESALIVEQGTIWKYDINIIKEFQITPKISIQKTKFVHIIINLLKNAKDSIVEKNGNKRDIIISLGQNAANVIVKLSDTGIGIKKEHLKKVFEHGFTTKEHGHGFGLHNCELHD